MAEAVIMPALEMAQETGVLVRWLKREGERVMKGEPVMEVETDKATVEIESPATGVLGGIRIGEGQSVPVGRTIAWILAPGEEPPALPEEDAASGRTPRTATSPSATPLARRIAEENGIDLSRVPAQGRRIEKADVLAHLAGAAAPSRASGGQSNGLSEGESPLGARLHPASPKARRIAAERGIELATLSGSGPGGAVLTADVEAAAGSPLVPRGEEGAFAGAGRYESPGSLWQIMAARMSESWTGAPHFYLMRELDAGNLVEWRGRIAALVEQRAGVKLTISDLLVKCVGAALKNHPRLNGSWTERAIRLNDEVNIGIATATEEGLVVPVIAHADAASLAEIAKRRDDLVRLARSRSLRPADLAGGTFTLTNLGMYNVDAFSAIVNPPQAAILAVGRIADRVVPRDGAPAIRPMMVVTLSCDHRVVDGARAARFLDEVADTIEEPWRLLV